MKQLELKENVSEYRGLPELAKFFGISGPLEFHCTEENQWFLNAYPETIRKRLVETLYIETKSLVSKKRELEYRVESILKTPVAIFKYQNFNTT